MARNLFCIECRPPILGREVLKLKRSYENAIFSNQGESCKEKFTCEGVLAILYFRVRQVNRSQLKIHAIVAGSNLIETYEFSSTNNTYQFGQWHQSKASEIIIDFRWSVRLHLNLSLEYGGAISEVQHGTPYTVQSTNYQITLLK